MVGGLVQQQHGRPGEQDAGQHHPRRLAAGEIRQRGGIVEVLDADVAAHLVHGVAEQPAVERVEPLLEAAVLVHGGLVALRHRPLERSQPPVDRVQLAGAPREMLAHRQVRVGRLLGEIADAVAGIGLDGAGIRPRDAGEDAKQRRLPAAVRADEAYAVAVTKDERNGVEERSGVVRRTERVCFQHGPSSLFSVQHSGTGSA